MATLLADKHIKYFKRCLTMLPSVFTEYDSSHVSLVYFCLGGLELLGDLESWSEVQKQQTIEWVYLHLVKNGQGFRGSMTHQVDGDSGFDAPQLAATFFCISMLAMLGHDEIFKRLDRNKVLGFVKNCQNEDGSFSGCYHESIGRFGETDVRQVYLAAAITRLLGSRENIDVPKALEFLATAKTYDGGYTGSLGLESHGGLAYCAIASRVMLENKRYLEHEDSTIDWLIHRQISADDDKTHWKKEETGGRNGRSNKPADTCYSFWVDACLAIYEKLSELSNINAEQSFLLTQCQHKLMGGFVKGHGSPPDPLHSYLGLAALSLLEYPGLKSLDPALCISKDAGKFITGLQIDAFS